jgi:hypothetical protein
VKRENKLEYLLKDARAEVETQGVDAGTVASAAGALVGGTLAGLLRGVR